MQRAKAFPFVVLLLAAFALLGIAQAQANYDSQKLPLSELRKMKPRSGDSREILAGVAAAKAANSARNNANSTAAASAGLAGVDSLPNWSDQFMAEGFDRAGNPQSVWPYTMVGNPPEQGGTTFISSPIVPVTVNLHLADGSVAVSSSPGRDVVSNVLFSPMFVPYLYPSGFGQFNDQMMRTSFWDRVHSHGFDNGYHTNLAPRLRSAKTMQIPFTTPSGNRAWFVFVDSAGNPVLFAIDRTVFANAFFPTTSPVDNSTPIGAAELAGDITTHDMSTFLFNNVVLFNGNINNCCVIGFHTYDAEPGDTRNGGRERRFVLNFSSWLSPGLFLFGFEDITPWSHELAETFMDPFVNNATPWWQSVDQFTGSGLCQDNLETGDVIEVLTTLPVYTVALNGRTYHPQNEALFPWFAFESPSPARGGTYSFPDETTLTSLSPSPLLPGCVAPK